MTDLFLKRDAVISDCGRYRYRLLRSWEAAKPRVLFIMLNPSTADTNIDDPTIRSCIRLARSWDYGGIEVVNLFAWRATDPNELGSASNPIGPDNDASIEDAAAHSDFTICAWGAHRMAGPRAQEVLKIIRRRHGLAHCLGVTKSGAPRHPLYIKTGTTPTLWPPISRKFRARPDPKVVGKAGFEPAAPASRRRGPR